MVHSQLRSGQLSGTSGNVHVMVGCNRLLDPYADRYLGIHLRAPALHAQAHSVACPQVEHVTHLGPEEPEEVGIQEIHSWKPTGPLWWNACA